MLKLIINSTHHVSWFKNPTFNQYHNTVIIAKPNSNCHNCDGKNIYIFKIKSSNKINNSTNMLKWPRYYGKDNWSHYNEWSSIHCSYKASFNHSLSILVASPSLWISNKWAPSPSRFSFLFFWYYMPWLWLIPNFTKIMKHTTCYFIHYRVEMS